MKFLFSLTLLFSLQLVKGQSVDLYIDSLTIIGQGKGDSPLKVDTNIVATKASLNAYMYSFLKSLPGYSSSSPIMLTGNFTWQPIVSNIVTTPPVVTTTQPTPSIPITGTEVNLLARSYNLTQAPWQLANMGATFGTTPSPLGVNDVTILAPNDKYAGSNYLVGATSLVIGNQYTLWLDVKSGSMNNVQLISSGTQTYIFNYNIYNQTVTDGNPKANGLASIENLQTTLGGAYAGWSRIKLTFTATTTSFNFALSFPQSVNGKGADTFFVWRAGLNPGTTPSNYLQKP